MELKEILSKVAQYEALTKKIDPNKYIVYTHGVAGNDRFYIKYRNKTVCTISVSAINPQINEVMGFFFNISYRCCHRNGTVKQI